MWIDVHSHLNMLEKQPEESIKDAQARGVERIITIGTNPEDHPIVLELAQKFYPTVVGTLGIHPHDAQLYTEDVDRFIRENAIRKEIVAIGEIGLDYYYEHSDREVQKKAFRAQLQIASDLGLPVEIHTRDAEDDTIQILQEYKGRVTGLLHCFTGTQALANRALELGFNISISGIVTFKNAEALRDVVRNLPLDRLHVETDAPFLAPMPHRGKKNVPAFVVDTAQYVADLKKIPIEELARITKLNAQKLFAKLVWN